MTVNLEGLHPDEDLVLAAPTDPTLEEHVARLVSASLEDALARTGVLTEARLRAVLQEIIDTNTGRGGSPGPTPPALRFPPKLIDPSRCLVYVDADDPFRWGPERITRTQQIIDGNRLDFPNGHNNPWADNIGPRLPTDQQAGYNLEFVRTDLGPAIHGHRMEDGTTLRFGIVERHGQRWLRGAGQYIPDGSYDPDNPLALNRGPGASGPLFHDGKARVQVSALDTFIRCGPGADQTLWAQEFIVEPWMFGSDTNSSIWALHAPSGGSQSGPMTCNISGGVIRFWSKTTGPNSDQSPLAFPGRQPSSRDHVILGEYDLRDHDLEPGDRVTLIAECSIDRSGNSPSYFHLWDLDYGPDPDLHEIASIERPYGYHYADTRKSGEFYPIVGPKLYSPSKWWPNRNWNWDNTTPDGNVRRIDNRYSLVAHRHQVSPADAASHAAAKRAAA